jgi:ATP-dependent Clp protease protease subunit
MHILPEIIEQTGRNKKTFSIPSKLFEENIVTLFDEVDDDLAYTIITQLLYLDTIDTTEPVKLYICSPGGSVTAGLAIIDVMNLMTRKVDTVGIGSVASMGAMLLCSGTGERKALENTRIMLHSVSSGSSARTEYQVIELKETELLQKKLMKMIADNTNGQMTEDEVIEVTQRNFYMSSTEAVKMGLIDSIRTKNED